MIFLPVRLGGAGATFPATTYPRVPFSFSTAVQSAHAVLESFHVQMDDMDRSVQDIQVSLVTFFDPVQSATSGEVEIQIQRTGSDGSIFFSSDLIQAEVRLLVIGI
jgi:hypothetical protein